VTARNETANLTSKNGVLVKMMEMSKALEETIRISTKRKISVDKIITALSWRYG
jgi:hypothetical protein